MNIFNNANRIEKDAERQIKVQKAKNKAITVLSHLELERLQNEKTLQPEREEITRLRCETESKNKLQKKSWSYNLSAIILSLISVFMSVAGISQQRNLLSLYSAFTGEFGIFAISVFLLQIVMLGFSFWSYEIQQNHFRTYNKVKRFQTAIICVSIYCNYQYMVLLMPENKIICSVFACAFDIGSIYFSELATVTKYRLYNNNNCRQNATFFEKLKIVLFGGIEESLNRKYQERIATRTRQEQKTTVNLDKQSNSEFESLLESMIKKIRTLKADTVVNKDTFELDIVTWQKARQELEKKGIVRCEKKKTYTNPNLGEITRELLGN